MVSEPLLTRSPLPVMALSTTVAAVLDRYSTPLLRMLPDNCDVGPDKRSALLPLTNSMALACCPRPLIPPAMLLPAVIATIMFAPTRPAPPEPARPSAPAAPPVPPDTALSIVNHVVKDDVFERYS